MNPRIQMILAMDLLIYILAGTAVATRQEKLEISSKSIFVQSDGYLGSRLLFIIKVASFSCDMYSLVLTLSNYIIKIKL